MGGGSKSQLLGYKYYIGMHIAVCHSPEESPVQSIRKIEAGERIAWEGNVTSNQNISINEPGLFGGERKEGGIVGILNVLFGRDSQTQNTYLQRHQGNDIPAYRGVFSLVPNRMYMAAISPYIKPWAIEVVRPASANWNSQWSNINDGANAAHMIREALTNNSWGLGLPVSLIDDTSFASVAETLFNEGFGLSMILTGQESIEEFIDRVLTHVNGVRIIDTTTGRYKIRLIRDDYTVSSLPIFDESNSELQNFERPQYAEMVNEITIVYLPQGEREKSSITVQDLASIQSQGGSVQQTLQFPGIDNLDIASRVGQRELRQHSTPLAQITLTTNRTGFEIEPGSVFRLNWDSYGINGVVFRAISVDIGDLTNGRIRIDAIEDIFSLPSASYIVNQPTQWEDPIQPPTPVTIQRAEELTYWDIQMQFATAELGEVTSTSAYYKLLAQKPNIATPGYELITRVFGASNFETRETGAYTPTAQLAADLSPGTTTGISIINVDSDLSFFTLGSYAYINDEIVRIDALNLITNSINIGRGCLDTVATNHLANSRIYFAENFDGFDTTQYATGVQVEGKALVQTGQNVLDESLAPIASETFVGRQDKPYPPGQLRFNSSAYPDSITGELTVSWAHRDREQQLVRPIISEELGNIGPETGVTYNLELYGEDGTTVRRTETGLTGTSYTWSDETEDSQLNGGTVGWTNFQVMSLTPDNVNSPSVVFNGTSFEMWYSNSSFNAIRRSTSTDGITWSTPQEVLLPGAQGTFDTSSVRHPAVVLDGATYKMLYTGIASGVFRILYAESTDGITWTNHQLAIDRGAEGNTDVSRVFSSPSFLKDGVTYKVWYSGRSNVEISNSIRLIYAESTDGITWTNHQVALDLRSEGTIDTRQIEGATVIKDGDLFFMFVSIGDTAARRIASAWSSDGLIWSGLQISIPNNSQGVSDTQETYYPSLLKRADNSYNIWYTGSQPGGTSTRIIRAQGNVIDGPLRYTPPSDFSLHMPLETDASILGTLSSVSLATNITNVTFSQGSAEFSQGYMDIGDFALSNNFSIVLSFRADFPFAGGTRLRYLIGKHQISGTGGTDIFSLSADTNSDAYRFFIGSSLRNIGRSVYSWQTILVTFETLSTTSRITVYKDGIFREQGSISRVISSWTGRDWMLGGDWDANNPTRNELFIGRMKDLRIYDNRLLTPEEVWTGGRPRLNNSIRARLWSERSGVESLQRHDFTVNRTA